MLKDPMPLMGHVHDHTIKNQIYSDPLSNVDFQRCEFKNTTFASHLNNCTFENCSFSDCLWQASASHLSFLRCEFASSIWKDYDSTHQIQFVSCTGENLSFLSGTCHHLSMDDCRINNVRIEDAHVPHLSILSSDLLVSFQGSVLNDATIRDTRLHGTFARARWSRCIWQTVDFFRSSFVQGILAGLTCSNCNLNAINAQRSTWTSVQFERTNLVESRFSHSTINYTQFFFCSLASANICHSSFEHVEMDRTSLYRTRLVDSRLCSCKFRDVLEEGLVLTNTSLVNVFRHESRQHQSTVRLHLIPDLDLDVQTRFMLLTEDPRIPNSTQTWECCRTTPLRLETNVPANLAKRLQQVRIQRVLTWSDGFLSVRNQVFDSISHVSINGFLFLPALASGTFQRLELPPSRPHSR